MKDVEEEGVFHGDLFFFKLIFIRVMMKIEKWGWIFIILALRKK